MEVMYDMLKVIDRKNGNIKQTQIMYKSNLSYKMMSKYLNELIQKNFVTEVIKSKKKTFMITEKGKLFIEKYASVREFRESFGIDTHGTDPL